MANEFIAKDYSGASVATTLAVNIAGGAMAITVTSGAGLLDGSGGPFVITINRGQPTEEKILILSRAANVLTVLQRGYDGTAAVGHNTPEPIEHTFDAWSIKHANAAIAAMTTRGDMVSRGAGLTFTRLPIGAAGLPLVAGATDPAWAQVGATGIVDRSVTGAKLAGSKWRRVATQAIPSSVGAITAIIWDTEDFDDLNTTWVTDTITIGTTGSYALSCYLDWASVPTSHALNFEINGAATLGFSGSWDAAFNVRYGMNVWLVAGDTVKLKCGHNAGGNINIVSTFRLTYLGG